MALSYIFSIWLILIIFLSLFKLKWGVALFLAYMILVPVVQLNVGSIRLGGNLFTTIFLICFFFYAKRDNTIVHWKPLVPFCIYFLVWLILMPLYNIPFGWMINQWRLSVMGMLILPFVMYNVMANDQSSIRLFRNTMLVCIVIAIGYGLVLTRMEGENPYQMLCIYHFGIGEGGSQDAEYYERYYSIENNEGRLFGRISSVYTHPMNFALFVGLSFVYIYSLKNRFRRLPFFVFMLAIVVIAVACGVRSVLGGLIVAVVFYLFVKRSFKLLFAVAAMAIVVFILMDQIPELNTYLGSMGDMSNKRHDVGGSSIELRLGQLRGALKEASKSPIIGLGYEWTSYYQSIHGNHPVCLAFESLIYVAVCNGAMVGCLLWIYLIIAVMVNNKRLSSDSALLNTALVFWIAYACITGEYGYMKTFLIFYILMLGEQLLLAREEQEVKAAKRAIAQEDNTITEASAPPSHLINKPETTAVR